MDLRRRGASRQLPPPPTAPAPVLHREHRPPPRAPPEHPGPELQPAARPRRAADPQLRADADAGRRAPGGPAEALGRRSTAPGDIPPSARSTVWDAYPER